MSTTNLGLHFYRNYYRGWDFANAKPLQPQNTDSDKAEKMYFEQQGSVLKKQTLSTTNAYAYDLDPNIDQSIKLTTSYPGLLLGSGYAHGIGAKGEYKIGFYFDHTTGLPIIPGSSVKGTIRSAFPIRPLKEEKPEHLTVAKGRLAYIQNLLVKKLGFAESLVTEAFILAIDAEIFEGQYAVDQQSKPRYMPMCQRDIFHDAVLTGPNDQAILGDDFITPHKNTKIKKDKVPHQLKNPNPIQFLKVLPNVEFGFQFRLGEKYLNHDGELVDRRLSVEQRLKLFKIILLDLGIGAKTNVGYGQFKGERIGRTTTVEGPKSGAGQTVAENITKKPDKVQKELRRWRNGESGIEGVVEKIEGQNVFFRSSSITDWPELLVVENLRANQLVDFKIGYKFSLQLESQRPKNGALPAKISSFRRIED